jgi:hypothetical protein
MNPGGDFDAYWRLSGNLTSNTTSDNHNTTHLDADFSGHAVLFGDDVNVVSLNSTIDTDTGQATVNGFMSPKSTGSLHIFLFGNEIPGGGSVDASTGFNFHFGDSQDYNLPPIEIWIFSITLGATASVNVDAQGGLAPVAVDVRVVPTASVGVHVEGGINLGIASGGVDARIDLLDVNTPLAASASWFLNLSPTVCATTLNFSFDGQAQISSGGGEVDLVATFGPCPFCAKESWTILKWDPLVSYTQPLFHAEVHDQAFSLPPSLCTSPLTVTISSPTSAIPGFDIPLQGTVSSPKIYANVPCSNYHWSSSQPADVVTQPTGPGPSCNNGKVNFASTGLRTLTLSAFYDFHNQFGTIRETGSTSESITVTSLPAGSYIVQASVVSSSDPNAVVVSPPPPLKSLIVVFDSGTTVIQLVGEVIGSTGTTSTWTATDSSGNSTDLGPGLSVTWKLTKFDNYSLTMTTKDSAGNTVGTATIPVMVIRPV